MEGFDADMMTSISDKFALADENRNEALDQSYFGLGQENIHAIFTAPQEKIKIKEWKNNNNW